MTQPKKFQIGSDTEVSSYCNEAKITENYCASVCECISNLKLVVRRNKNNVMCDLFFLQSYDY